MGILDISLERANEFYTWGWRLSIVGAVVTALGVGLLMWGTRVRDHDFEFRMTRANSDAAKVNENAAMARERAAIAEQRAAEATLELAKFRAPRTLTAEQQNVITEKLRAFPNVRFDATVIRDDPETHYLLDKIAPALAAAGWTQVSWDNNDTVLKRPDKPDLGEWAAQNVIIAVPHDLIPQLWSAADSLASALTAEGIPGQAQDAKGMILKNNAVLHLLIGRKT